LSDDPRGRLVEAIFSAVEKQNVGSAIRCCQRLSLRLSDYVNYAYFVYELEHARTEDFRHLQETLSHLDTEQLKLIDRFAVERKIRVRAIDDEDAELLGWEKGNVIFIGCDQIDAEIEAIDGHIASLAIPANVNYIDAAYFFAENDTARQKFQQKKLLLRRITNRILASAFNYATKVEKFLFVEQKSGSALARIEKPVFSFLEHKVPEGLAKLEMAAKLFDSPDAEDRSNAVTQIRRCLKSIADQVGPIESDNSSLKKDKYLNRISYFVETTASQSGKLESALLKPKELENLVRSINERASKGVHASVSTFEAQQVYFCFILYLSSIAELTRSS